MSTLSDFSAPAIDGTPTDLSAYDGKVVLVVNTASQCGFTGQYKGLQELQDTYADQGLVVLGFPCDQFGNQEPGDADRVDERTAARDQRDRVRTDLSEWAFSGRFGRAWVRDGLADSGP